MGEAIDIVVNSPGRAFSSAVQMSQMAPFVDRGGVDRSDELRQHVHLVLHLGRR